MVAGAIPAGEKLGWGLGKVEEVLGKVLVQGIEIWWPEEGDRRERAMAERADELHSVLVDVRRKEEMTAGAHNQVKYLGVTLPVGWFPWPLDAGVRGGRYWLHRRGGRYFIYRPSRGAWSRPIHNSWLRFEAGQARPHGRDRTAPRDDHAPPRIELPRPGP